MHPTQLVPGSLYRINDGSIAGEVMRFVQIDPPDQPYGLVYFERRDGSEYSIAARLRPFSDMHQVTALGLVELLVYAVEWPASVGGA